MRRQQRPAANAATPGFALLRSIFRRLPFPVAGPALTVVLGLTLVWGLASGPLLVAEPPPSLKLPPPTASLRVETRLVLVDVVATDKNGHAVEGLTREDFALAEDGRSQEIAFFSREGQSQTASAPAALPPNVYTNHPDYYRAPGALTLVLLDALNTPRKDQMLMREELLRYFKSPLPANQWTALLALTDQLRVLQDFTPNRELLLAAVKDYTPQQAGPLGVREQVLSRETEEEHAALQEMIKWCGDPCRDFLDSLKRFEEAAMAASDKERMQRTLAALRTLGQGVAGYPGRKNLIWVSASFPVFYPGDRTGRHRWSADAEVRATAQLLNDARVAIYPVDPRGLVDAFKPESYQDFEARMSEAAGSPPGYSPSPTGPEPSASVIPSRSPRHPQQYLYASQSAMKVLAETTGGLAFYNRNDLANAVGVAVADGSSYYALGYYPKNEEWSGAFRRIEVKLARSGLRLRYRQGYYATRTPSGARPTAGGASLDDELVAALEAPLPATGIVFRAHVPPPAPGSSSRVSVEFWFDSNILLRDPEAGGAGRLDVDCVVGAFSPDGALVQTVGQRAQWIVPSQDSDETTENGVSVPASLDLPPGNYHLRLLVCDNHSRRLGRVDLPLTLPAATAHGLPDTASHR